LIKYVSPSPDQEDAGSCLYMSTTGVVEWWLGKLNSQSTKANTPDLSERFLMNADGVIRTPSQHNWRTDKIFLVNELNGAAPNKNYRYTKGWYREPTSGITKANRGEKGAKYGT